MYLFSDQHILRRVAEEQGNLIGPSDGSSFRYQGALSEGKCGHKMKRFNAIGAIQADKHFLAKHCAMLATRAALYEAAVAPKPGLVDRLDQGAHQDMDIFTFINSATALTPYFERFFLLGYTEKNGYEQLFSWLRGIGREAEQAMFLATGGINTHKGLIFLMAIFCSGLGYQWAKNKSTVSQTSLRECCAALGQFSLADFQDPYATNTAGSVCYAQHGIAGIRGEVCTGFSTVFETGLPALCRSIETGYSFEEGCCVALLYMMARTYDTNMIKRGGFKQAQRERQRIEALLLQLTPQTLRKTLSELNQDYSLKGLSPGGCADLLAITIFSYFLERECCIDSKTYLFRSLI